MGTGRLQGSPFFEIESVFAKASQDFFVWEHLSITMSLFKSLTVFYNNSPNTTRAKPWNVQSDRKYVQCGVLYMNMLIIPP